MIFPNRITFGPARIALDGAQLRAPVRFNGIPVGWIARWRKLPEVSGDWFFLSREPGRTVAMVVFGHSWPATSVRTLADAKQAVLHSARVHQVIR